MSKGFYIFGFVFKGLLGVSFLFMFFGISNAAVIETTGEDNCNRVDTIDLGAGWSVKHLSLHADRHVNVGRTEVYYNNERLEFHDTVFYANSRWTWWYSAPSCATHSKISSASFNNGILDLSFDSFNPQSGPGFGTYATTTRARLDSNPLQLNIGKQEIDAIVINPYAIGSGFNHVMKLNLFSSGTHVGGASIRTEAFVGGTDARSGTRLSSAYYYGHSGCSLGDVNQNDYEYVINFTCGLTFTKTSSAINGSGYTRTNNYEGSFSLSKDRYDLCSYDEQLCEDSLPTPTNLTQSIESLELDKQEVGVGEQIGKFQSGSGVIFNVDVENPGSILLRLAVKYNKNDGVEEIRYSDVFNGGVGELTLPYSGAGNYIWSAAISNEDMTKVSDWVEFEDNLGEADFTLYEGFEPYPFGYNFENSRPVSGMLDGGFITNPFGGEDAFRITISGNKWDIYDKAFRTDGYDERKRQDSFEYLGLKKSVPSVLNVGSCYGLSLSSSLQYKNPSYFDVYYPEITEKTGNTGIWNSIKAPQVNDDGLWDTYDSIFSSNDDGVLESIFALQLSQKNVLFQEDLYENAITNLTEISNKLQENSGKLYLLGMQGMSGEEPNGHMVVAYKYEDDKIYIYDNTVPYPLTKDGSAYNQYIQLDLTNDSWDNRVYDWTTFDQLTLIDVNEYVQKGLKSEPIGLNDTDTLISLQGESNLYIKDEYGNITGYYNGEILNEISGAKTVVTFANIINDVTDTSLKQIYFPEKIEDYTIYVDGKNDEEYDLMIAGGDYYTKIEGVSTNDQQTDIYVSKRDLIDIDFDENKVGTYNVLTDDFYEDSTGTIYLHEITATDGAQQIVIDWDKVNNKQDDSIQYMLDINNDGAYDIESTFSSLPSKENELGSISGYLTGNTNATMAGWKVYLDLNNNGLLEENEESFTVTNNTGYYEFNNISKGNYIVKIVAHKNWNLENDTYNMFLNNGQNTQNLNFTATKINGKTKK